MLTNLTTSNAQKIHLRFLNGQDHIALNVCIFIKFSQVSMKMLGHFGVLFGFIVLSSASYDIANQNLTNWGDWGTYEVCSNGTFAQGFQLKVEESQGCGTDDSALNGIRLYCRKPNDFLSLAQIISSSVGQYGSWKHVFLCFPGYITGFGLRVEPELNGLHDNSAANNVRFHCSNREDFVLGDGMAWGRWMPDQHCNEGDAICGIQTQVHEAECCKFKII